MKKLSTHILAVNAWAVLLLAGCGVERTEPVVEFEPNLVHTTKYQMQKGLPMDQAAADATWILDKLFGTPDDPKLPSFITSDQDLAAVVSIERLQQACGPAEADQRGLFRKHCAVCHGVTGNGRGPTAAVQVPYPRDYRMGLFKFKSTPRGSKPTRADLKRLISQGIGGTAMIKIPELSESDIEALIDYVIYLSWRGELERRIIDDAMFELDLEGGDRILNTEMATLLAANPELADQLDAVLENIDGEELTEYETYLAFEDRLAANPKLKSRLKGAAKDDPELAEDVEALEAHEEFAADLADDEEFRNNLADAKQVTSGQQLIDYETYVESWEIITDFAVEIAESWLEADEDFIEVPEPPDDIPLANSYADVLEFRAGEMADQFEASVKRGQALFVSKTTACSKCHGPEGLGNGQTTDYDDWTKDWTTRVGLQPEDRESIIPLLARGALPPKNAIPRNFSEGVFRGGAGSDQLFRRITQGIDGTPMPASTFVEGEYEERDVWHIVNFIRSLQTAPLESEPVAADTDQTGGAQADANVEPTSSTDDTSEKE